MTTRFIGDHRASVDRISPKLSGRESVIVAVTIVLVTTLITFCRVTSFDFVNWDDTIHVVDNPHLRHFDLQEIGFFWLHEYQGLFIPISYTVFAIISLVAHNSAPPTSGAGAGVPFDPHIFHAANLFLHLFNAFSAFFLLRRFTKKDLPATLGALVFAVHPLQVESVAWVSELRGLLGAAFIFTALHLYLTYDELRLAGRTAASRTVFVLSVCVSFCAMLSKPSFATTGLIIGACSYWVCRRPWQTALLHMLPFLVVGQATVNMTTFAQPFAPGTELAWRLRPLIAADALNFYAFKFAVPLNLTIDYARKPGWVLAHWWAYVEWTVPVAALSWAIVVRKSAWYVLFGGFVFFAALLPVLGLKPFAFQEDSTTADRYAYVALFGASIIVAYYLSNLGAAAVRTVVAGVCAWIAALVVLAFNQTLVWQDNISLYAHAVAVNPGSAVAEAGVAGILMDEKAYTLAIQRYRMALAADPNNVRYEIALSDSYRNIGDQKDAEAYIRLSCRQSPNSCAAFNDLGSLLLSEHRDSEGKADLDRAFALDPADYQNILGVGAAFAQNHDYADAEKCYSSGVAQYPRDGVMWRALGMALYYLQRKPQAERALTIAAQLHPSDGIAKTLLQSLNATSGVATRAGDGPADEERRALE